MPFLSRKRYGEFGAYLLKFKAISACQKDVFLFSFYRVKVIIDRVGRADIIAVSTISPAFTRGSYIIVYNHLGPM